MKIKRFYILTFAAIFLVMTVAPLPLLGMNERVNTPIPSDTVFLVYDTKSGKIEAVEEFDYIVGVLAGEMSPDTPKEALKAQAVAAYTYAIYKRNIRIEKGNDYDLTSDHSKDQQYLSKTEQVALWQENYQKNRKILEDAVREVEGTVITFSGRAILSVYHSVSSGKTEAAEDVWNTPYPYLQAVESTGDLLAPDYTSEVIYTSLDFADKALDLGITLVGEPDSWLSSPERSASGGVIKYTLANHEVSGTDMRSAFGLNSTNFQLEYLNERFVFTVKGHGHGIGMSQFGAVYMAKQGSSFEQILEHYYPGTVIVK